MKLIKAVPVEYDEFVETLEMKSDNIEILKAKGYEIARALGNNDAMWVSRYPIMGDNRIEDIRELQMELLDGTILTISD